MLKQTNKLTFDKQQTPYDLYTSMCANEQTRYANYAFNSSYVNRKQNKTHTHCAKNKATFTLGKQRHRYQTSEFFD